MIWLDQLSIFAMSLQIRNWFCFQKCFGGDLLLEFGFDLLNLRDRMKFLGLCMIYHQNCFLSSSLIHFQLNLWYLKEPILWNYLRNGSFKYQFQSYQFLTFNLKKCILLTGLIQDLISIFFVSMNLEAGIYFWESLKSLCLSF